MTHLVAIAILALTLTLTAVGEAYNGGPLLLVTDLASSCAGCHASVQKEQLRNLPEGLQNAQWVENKHYTSWRGGRGRTRT
jgi:hypothetical protein